MRSHAPCRSMTAISCACYPLFRASITRSHLRGNVVNPGRYPWKPGMRVRDLIPDAQALLTRPIGWAAPT